jgi:hypothetical protein
VLSLKYVFLRSLLDWVVIYVPNLPSSNLLNLVNFLDFRHLLGWLYLLYNFCLLGLLHFPSINYYSIEKN